MIGQTVQEAIDLMNSGSNVKAMVPTAAAIDLTVRRVTGTDVFSELNCERFIKGNWDLITFMGMSRALPLSLDIPVKFKRIMPAFNVHHGAQEIVSLAVTETLKLGLMPGQFAFNSTGRFEIKDKKLLLPSGLVCGLLGSVIFNPLNKDETIGDKYWISISDFKMFVSELFGRNDLAERIMRFYKE